MPLKVAYNQWTEFGAFPSFMKKVENAEAADDNKINFKAQIFLSHRTWEATILEQIPDECIVWRSKGQKGHVDGAVTFHEIGPNLTRILVVLEYYPQGLFEKTGNIWEAQGRRARAELRHFRRHVMTRTILDPDEVEGWRGRIEDSEVVETHEEALEREEQEEQEQDEYDEPEASDESEEEPEDEYDEGVDEEPEDEDAEGEPEDEYDEAEEPEEETPRTSPRTSTRSPRSPRSPRTRPSTTKPRSPRTSTTRRSSPRRSPRTRRRSRRSPGVVAVPARSDEGSAPPTPRRKERP